MVELKRFDPGASRGMRRLRLGFTAALLSVFALAALYFTLGLAEDPALRWRVDLSEVGRNTLDPATEDVLTRLEEPAVVHVFFRRENTLVEAAREEARTRMLDLLLVASKLAPDRIEMKVHDMTALADVQAEFDRLGLGPDALRSDSVNLLVIEQAERHVLIRLEPEIAEIGADPMDPSRAAVLAFRGEEALVDGLLKVAAANRPKLYFSIGHGEASLEDEGLFGLSRLAAELAGDGFDLFEWNGAQNGPLPDDADVLAIVAPTDPFGADELRFVEDFVLRGGRLMVLVNELLVEGEGSLAPVLARFGIMPRPGLVCIPTISQDLGRMTTGLPACAQFQIELAGLNSTHPITKPIWAASRKVPVVRSVWFERGAVPPGGSLQDILVQRKKEAWNDRRDVNGRYDYVIEMGAERFGPFSLAMASELPLGEQEARAIGIGSGVMAANQIFGESTRDFLLNGFNWLAERDFNVRVGFRADKRTQIDVLRGTEILWIRRFAWYGLPGALLAVALLLAWRRRA